MSAAPMPSGPSASAVWTRALQRVAAVGADPARTFPVILDALARDHGPAPALIGEGGTLSHAAFAARRNAVARWALREGYGRGDTIALLMRNRPDYLALWLGLTRIGVRVALLNTALTGAGLAHCLAASGARALVVETALAASLGGIADLPPLWWYGEDATGARLDAALPALDGAPLRPAEAPVATLSDDALLIYTSGTTGLPKAARVSHHRVVMWTHWFAGLIDPTPDDRMYDCLPLYHSVGGVVAPGSVLLGGGSVVIRERFSAGRFWDDVSATGCTLFQYIGELCRYLALAPPHPLERAHSLRLCAGNGLRPDVWEGFRDRFAIPRIVEFYAATEGTVSLYNVEGRVGAVGRVPPFMAHRSPALIVRHDPETGLPARGADGLCVAASRGEAGELLGRLSDRPEHRFEGYTDAAANGARIVRDVLRPGDAWTRTGDLMRQDAAGFFHFVDRVGDTFRWKGENVATTEVEQVIAACPGVREAVVYGVRVPGADGRAGMAALTVEPGFDPATLHAWVSERLPAYARPLFLRIVDGIAVTGTFKPVKARLAEEGFDPAVVSDPLHAAGPEGYRALDAALFAALRAGRARV